MAKEKKTAQTSDEKEVKKRTTRAVSQEEYELIIDTLRNGYKTAEGKTMRPNEAVAAALNLEATTGMRIGDILALRLCDIIKDGDRYRLDIIEQKTGKARKFTIAPEIYAYMQDYCLRHDIGRNNLMFPKTEGAYHHEGTPKTSAEHLTERAVQKALAKVCAYLHLEDISTHSFRKYFATDIYNSSKFNIELVRTLLQHASATTTQRYITIGTAEQEEALSAHSKKTKLW